MKVTFSCEDYLGPYEEKVRDTRFFCRAGINIASILIDGRICACPNIDRDLFSQGSIYTDNFYEVWQHRFQPYRRRDWARGRETDRICAQDSPCVHCKQWRDCLGGSLHNWHAATPGEPRLLQCRLSQTRTAIPD
jgi:radical SAM protein with 4Fe4S-binding SPASM domain